MERLKEKYGLSDECIDDVKKTITDSITEMMPIIIEEIGPIIMNNISAKIKSDAEKLDEMNKKRKIALKYVQDNIKDWERTLENRNKTYWQYIRTVSTLDLYTECLEEEPMYIPRKFRKDKTHYRNAEEKREVERMNHERLKSEMQILQIRKSTYYNEMQHKDKEDEDFFRREITDPEILDNVLEIWNTSKKKDEEIVHEKWVKKNEGMRQNFEKDKEKNRTTQQVEPEHREMSESIQTNVENTHAETPPTHASTAETTATATTTTTPHAAPRGTTTTYYTNRNNNRNSRNDENPPNNRNIHHTDNPSRTREEQGTSRTDTSNQHRIQRKNSNSNSKWSRTRPPARDFNLRSSTYLRSLSANTT